MFYDTYCKHTDLHLPAGALVVNTVMLLLFSLAGSVSTSVVSSGRHSVCEPHSEGSEGSKGSEGTKGSEGSASSKGSKGSERTKGSEGSRGASSGSVPMPSA